MAIIILEPGEKFEHSHSTESTSELLEGKVKLRIEEREFEMTINKIEKIPQDTKHTMINIGNSRAKIVCPVH